LPPLLDTTGKVSRRHKEREVEFAHHDFVSINEGDSVATLTANKRAIERPKVIHLKDAGHTPKF
jgi:hypothetical protein